MTSIPALRSLCTITFAPTSWPSRPGLAIKTRMGLRSVIPDSFCNPDGEFLKSNGPRFLVFSENLFQRRDDLSHGRPGLHCRKESRENVLPLFGGLSKGSKRFPDFL